MSEPVELITFPVLGTPAPKGSSRAILIRGRAVNVPGGSNTGRTKLKHWDVSVRDQAAAAVGDTTSPPFVGRPLRVEIEFRLTRPQGHWSSRGGLKPSAPAMPSTKPDIDKLVRATVDSLIGIVFDDDSRIVELVARKTFAIPGNEGASITIREWQR